MSSVTSVIDLNDKRKAEKELTDLEAYQQRRLKRAKTGEKKQDDASSSSPRGLNPPVDSDLPDTKDQGGSPQQPVPALSLRLGLRPESPTQYPTDEQSQSPIARRSSPPIPRPRARSKSPEIQRAAAAASPFGPPPQLPRASPPVSDDDDDESQLPQASTDVKDADVRRGQIPVSRLRLEFERLQSSQQPVALPPAEGSQNPVQAISQLVELKRQLDEINNTLEATKTSDAACKEALEQTRDQLTACKGELEKLHETYEALANVRTDLKKNEDELAKQRALSAALVAEKNTLIADKNALIAKNIKESKALETKLQAEIDRWKELLRTEKETSETRKKELDDGFNNFQELENKFNKQTERMGLLEDELKTADAKKKRLAKELQAERERKPNVNKEKLFWTLFLDPGFPKERWQAMRIALLPETEDITEQVIKDRLKEMKAPLHLLDSDEVRELKVQLRAVQDELEQLKKEKEDLSKAVVRRRSPSPSSDMKDDPLLTALVPRKRVLSDCEKELQQARAEILALGIKINDLERVHNLITDKLKDDISGLNERLHALRKENDNLRNTFAPNPLDDAKARLNAIEDCDKERNELRRERDKLQADLDQCHERVRHVEAQNATFVGIQKECQDEYERYDKEIESLKTAHQIEIDKLKARIEEKKTESNGWEGALHFCKQEKTKLDSELKVCLADKKVLEEKFQGLSATAQKSIALRKEEEKMVAFMNSFIKNLTERADDTDTKRLEERTEKQIAEARVMLAEYKLDDAMKKIQRSVIQLRTREAEQARLIELLRRTEWEKGDAERRAIQAGELKLSSQTQSKEQILADANKKLNKTACNFIEDSLEFLIGGATGYINTGLPQRSEKKEAAMFYIHALCAEPHWAFLVARYLGKDYTMAYPLSEQIQLVLLDENENYEPESRSGRIHRSRNGWFSSSRRAKVIRVFDAFIMDMHYHRGMRQLRNIHGRPKDTMRSQDPGSFQLPEAAWVLKRVRFWNEEDEKPLYSREDRMAITKEIIRAYQLFDLFDLDTSVPPVEIGWKAFMTDGDAQPDIAAFVTHLVHKRSYGDAGHELIWGTIRDNPSLLRYWRYEYPEPLVLLLPLWNYIMYVLNSNYHGPQLEKRIDQIKGSRDLLTRIQAYLPKVREVHEQSVERMAQQRRRS